MLNRQRSDDRDDLVNANSIALFIVNNFRGSVGLDGRVFKYSITTLTSQVDVYRGWGGLELNTPVNS